MKPIIHSIAQGITNRLKKGAAAWFCRLVAMLSLIVAVPLAAAQAQPALQNDVPVVSVVGQRKGVSLAGDWQFQPGDDMAWASPSYNDSAWGSLAIPGQWPEEGYPETGQFGWYRLTLQFDLENPGHKLAMNQLGIRMGKVMSAYELYAGGQLLGGIGKLPPLSEVNWDRQTVFAIPPDAVDRHGRLVLALRVWGGSQLGVRQFGAGPYEGDFTLGNYGYLLKSGVVGQMSGLLVAFLFGVFGIYHLYLYRRNRQLASSLWFGLMAVNLGIYALMLNQWRYLLGWSFISYEKIEFGAIYLFPAVGMQLLWVILEQPINRFLRLYQAGFVLTAVAVVAIPGLDVHYLTLAHWQLYTLPLVIYGPILIVREARAGNTEARTAMIGVFIFAATCLNDLSVDLLDAPTGRLLPYGFVAIVISMAISLANRLTSTLNSLEDEVAERTSELEEANKQLAKAARHDPLTGLFNRRGFNEAAKEEMDRVQRSGREFAVLLADIDNFKRFNDRYGHAFGDHVLRRVADILGKRIRDVDRAGRWGGEEFIFLLPETDADGAAVLAEKLRENIATNVFEFGGERVSVTITFGVAIHRQGEPLETCIARADTALYQGKKLGRNRVMIGSYRGLSLVN